MPPPSQRTRAYKRENSATGGSEADSRPFPKVLNPQEDALDARGYFLQDSNTADALVVIWRENGELRFRDASMDAGLSYSLNQLAASGGGGGGVQNAHTIFSLSEAHDKPIFLETAGYGRSEVPENQQGWWRWQTNLEEARWARLSVVILDSMGAEVTLVAEVSLDGGNTFLPLNPNGGHHGYGGPDVVMVKSGPSSEAYIHGGSDNLLSSGWVEIDPAYRRHDVWIRLAFHNPNNEAEYMELAGLKLEVAYWAISKEPSEPVPFEPIELDDM